MGEPEHLVAEPDEMEEEEMVAGLHPSTLEQKNPSFISNITSLVVSFVCANGWFVVGLLVLGYVAWLKLEPKVKDRLRKKEKEKEAAEYQKNPDAVLAKERAFDEARRRLQEQYNIAAAISLEKQKEMEQKKKEEKIKEWERTQPSGGRTLRSPDRSGASASANSSTTTTTTTTTNKAKEKPANKARLRPEYNPLTGDTGASSSCRWRPSAQRPSGGG